LDSTSVLQANPENPAAMVYKKVGTDGKKYKKFMIDPIEIYRGADAEFRNVSIEDQKKVAESVRQQSLLHYQKAIQTGFREVEDALVDQLKSREKLDAQMHQVSALRTYKNLALMRYENGYSSYLEVLDAERNLFSVELAYVQTRGNQFQALVNLYKAMGGGWITATDKKRQAAGGKK